MLQRLERFIFYTLVFSVPFQTRVVLKSWGLGFNEWNSAFLYWTDLLILVLLGLWLLRQLHFNDMSLKVSWRRSIVFSNYDWFLIGLLVVSAVSIKNALNPALGWYQLFKLTEFSLLYFYVKSNLWQIFNLITAFFVFLFSGLFQAVLAIFQYLKQSDLGLRFLGETVLSPDLFNVAIFLVNGEKILRPYGTTPHPNVLALFLFIAVFIYYFFYIQKNKFLYSKTGLIFYSILLFGFFFTFSRIIISVWLIIFLILFLWNRGLKHAKKIVLTTIFTGIIFSILFWPQVLTRLNISLGEEAVSLRGFYNKVALFEKPFFGVGLGNFVNWFREINPGLAQNLYQPVHNIYLLIFSETGISGLAMFLLFLLFLARDYLKIKFDQPFLLSFFIFFASLLFFGLFDHFLWTLQQGKIILFLTAGLLAGISPHSSVDRAQASGA